MQNFDKMKNHPNKINSEIGEFFAVWLSSVRNEVTYPLQNILGGASTLQGLSVPPGDVGQICSGILRGANAVDRILSDSFQMFSLLDADVIAKPQRVNLQDLMIAIRQVTVEPLRCPDVNINADGVGHSLSLELDLDLFKKSMSFVLAAFAVRGVTAINVDFRFCAEAQCNIELSVIENCDSGATGHEDGRCSELGSVLENSFYLRFARLLFEKMEASLSLTGPTKSGASRVLMAFNLADGKSSQAYAAAITSSSSCDVTAELPLKGLRVLLADDSPDNQVLLKYFLTSLGASFDSANDGIHVLDKAMEQHYDVVLMDLQMPRMNGHEATAELRRRGCKIPVIGLTAHLGHSEKASCVEAGFSDCIERPVSKAELMSRILRLVVR